MTQPPGGGNGKRTRPKKGGLPVISIDKARPLSSHPVSADPYRKKKLKFAPAEPAETPVRTSAVAAPVPAPAPEPQEQPIMPLMVSGSASVPFPLDESDPLLHQGTATAALYSNFLNAMASEEVSSRTSGNKKSGSATPMVVENPSAQDPPNGPVVSKRNSSKSPISSVKVHPSAQNRRQRPENSSEEKAMEVDDPSPKVPQNEPGKQKEDFTETSSSGGQVRDVGVSTSAKDELHRAPKIPREIGSKSRGGSSTNSSAGHPGAAENVSASVGTSHHESIEMEGTVFTVYAPPGKLGLFLHGTDSIPYVTRVSETSTMASKIKPHDRILAVNGRDVSGLQAAEVTEVFKHMSGFERKLVVSRPRGEDHPEPESASERASHGQPTSQGCRDEQIEGQTKNKMVRASEQPGQNDETSRQTQAAAATTATAATELIQDLRPKSPRAAGTVSGSNETFAGENGERLDSCTANAPENRNPSEAAVSVAETAVHTARQLQDATASKATETIQDDQPKSQPTTAPASVLNDINTDENGEKSNSGTANAPDNLKPSEAAVPAAKTVTVSTASEMAAVSQAASKRSVADTQTGDNAIDEGDSLVTLKIPRGSVGVTLGWNKSTKITHVTRVTPNGPAVGRFFIGDKIVELDGCNLRGKKLKEVTALMKAKKDLDREVTILRAGDHQPPSSNDGGSTPQSCLQNSTIRPSCQESSQPYSELVSQRENEQPLADTSEQFEDAVETYRGADEPIICPEPDESNVGFSTGAQSYEEGPARDDLIDVAATSTEPLGGESAEKNSINAPSAMPSPTCTSAEEMVIVEEKEQSRSEVSRNEGQSDPIPMDPIPMDPIPMDEENGSLHSCEPRKLIQERNGTPTLLEPPRASADDPDMKKLFERVENSIVEAEEKWLLDKIDRSIIAAEEKELLARTEQYIIAAEQAPMPAFIGSKVSCLSTPEDADDDSDSPDGDMLAQWSEASFERTETVPETTRVSEPGTSITQLDNQNLAEVEVHKVLPKYVENSNRKIFNRDTVQNEIVDWISKQKWSSKGEARVVATLNNAPFDDNSVILYLRGRVDVVESVKSRILKVIRAKMRRFNLKTLLSDRESVELDLKWDCKAKPHILPVPIADERGSKRSEGLWLSTKRRDDDELSNIIGYGALSRGAAIVKVNDISCATRKRFNEIIQEAKSRPKSAVKLTICISKHADLGKINESMLWPGTKCRQRKVSNTPSSRKRKSPDTSKSDVTAPPAKRAPVHSPSHAKAPAMREPDKLSTYLDFVKKFEEVRDIEYRNVKIRGQFVSGRMWNRHKELGYGTTCGDDCACALDLSRLTETVVPEHIAEEVRKDPNWSNPHSLKAGASPEGFITNFASKFVAKLTAEYPADTPVQTLQRLVRMWPMHKRTRVFGLKCRRNCTCAQGWEPVFKKGAMLESGTTAGASDRTTLQGGLGESDHKKRPNTSVLSRSQSLDSACHKQASPRSSTNSVAGGGNANRRRSLDTMTLTTSSPQPATAGSSVQRQGSTDPSLLRRSSSPKASSSSESFSSKELRENRSGGTQQKEYFVTFDARAPLGFFCVTERNDKVCKIVSVNPHIKTRDPRLFDGTIVRSAQIVKDSASYPLEELHSSWDLRSCYENAKKKGANLRLAFINSDVKASSWTQAPNKDWKTSGVWQGKRKDGWPGGAASKYVAEKGRNERKQGTFAPSTKNPGAREGKDSNRSTGSPTLPIAEMITQDERRPPSRSGSGQSNPTLFPAGVSADGIRAPPLSSQGRKPGPSLLRRRQKAAPKESTTVVQPGMSLRNLTAGLRTKSKNRVKFSNSFEVRYYRKGSQSCDFSPDQIDSASEAASVAASVNERTDVSTLAETPNKQHPGELDHAIREKGCREMIRVLYAGVPKRELLAANGKIKELLKAMHPWPEKVKKLELELKRKAAIIFVHCAHEVELAKDWKKTMHYELEIVKMERLTLTHRGRQQGAGRLRCRVSVSNGSNEVVQKPLMPEVELSSDTLVWDTTESNPRYLVSYNASLQNSAETLKEVILTLENGNSSNSTGTVRLGRFIIPVSRITEVVEEGGHMVEANLIGSEYLSSGTVLVRVRRKPPDAVYFKHKKKEIAEKLAKGVDWMEQFNDEELVKAGSMSMSGNIILEEKGNFSLLHAAVSVGDLSLVKRLMDLGADPTAKSEVGSAIYFASNLEGATESSGMLRNIIAVLKGHKVDQITDLAGDDSQEMECSDGDSVEDGDTPRRQPEHPSSQACVLPGSEEQPGASHGLKPLDPIPQEEPQNHLLVNRELQTSTSSDSISENSAAAAAAVMAQLLGESTRDSTSDTTFETKGVSMSPAQGDAIDKGPSSSQSQSKDDDLPRMYNPDWMVVNNMRRCTYFNKAVGCRYGNRCHHAHVRSPMGSFLDSESNSIAMEVKLDSNGVREECRRVPFGGDWFTAAYQDPRDSIIYYAERGANSHLSSQGVYWYPTKHDAFAALKRVVGAWRQQALNAQGVPAGHAKGERTQSTGSKHVEHSQKQHNHGTTQQDVFRMLIGYPNLSSALSQVTGGTHLKKGDWACWEKDGYVTAQFTLHNGQLGGIYKPTAKFDGHWMFDTWWHRDEKAAKASAFLGFLEAAAMKGLVTRDLCHTTSGKTLAFYDAKLKGMKPVERKTTAGSSFLL